MIFLTFTKPLGAILPVIRKHSYKTYITERKRYGFANPNCNKETNYGQYGFGNKGFIKTV